jgi:hypothetical protein
LGKGRNDKVSESAGSANRENRHDRFSAKLVTAAVNLDLGEAAIDKQFGFGDVAAVIGRERHHRLSDLIGCAEPAERNDAGNHLQAFRAPFPGSQQLTESGRVGGAGAHT